MKKSIFQLLMALVLLASSFSSIFAMDTEIIIIQDEEEPGDEEEVEDEEETGEEEGTDKVNPIWQLMVDFYADFYGYDLVLEDVLPSDNKNNGGYGLVTKLLSHYLSVSTDECEEGDECPVFSLEGVVEEGKLAPGQLFKEFGKPEFMGVGHLRKAYQEWLRENQMNAENAETEQRQNNGNGVGVPGGGRDKNKDKIKVKVKDQTDD